MALAQFGQPPLTTMFKELAGSGTLTVFVGAGVSMEADLPSWWKLVHALLDRAAVESLGLADEDVRRRWQGEMLRGETPLGAAAVVEALASGDLKAWIPEEMYGPSPASFQPGPIARQLAALRLAYGPGLRLLTTNYDDLIEQAIHDAGIGVEPHPYAGPNGRQVPGTDEAHQRVVHLHGYLARDGDHDGAVILSESDYQQVAKNDWQGSLVGSALLEGPCVFIGSSLTDPNLLRYLHRHAGPGSGHHYAVFTRQDTYEEGTPAAVIGAREAALQARWAASNVEIVFVDHYAEIALVLAEIARAKRMGVDYVPVPTRLATWRRTVGEALLAPHDPEQFAGAQDVLHLALRAALDAAVQTAAAFGTDFSDEVLAATLWLVDEDATSLTSWATTDRVHRDPNTIEPVPIGEYSSWVGVRAFCRGASLGEPRDIYASRWRYIRGLPLVTREGLPIGVLTVSSMMPAGETKLDAMPDPIEAAFDEALREAALDILEFPFAEQS